jgi:dTDP-4-dehydrorhamnose reductase
MNVLVTGANGQLGSCLRRESIDSPHNFIFTDIQELDITNADDIQRVVSDTGAEVIVNCAAYTNVDKAEDDEALAYRLNATAPTLLAQAMKRRNGLLIHISTDYVFGGNDGNLPKIETEPTNPTGVYGSTKLAGERGVIATGVDAIIIRTAWLYSEYGNNFVKTMMRLMAEKPQLNVVFDQVGTPTYAGDLAIAILSILNQNIEKIKENLGIYHFSNEGVASWYDFAIQIAEDAGMSACEVMPCHSSQFPSKVVRPPFSVLDKSKIKDTFALKIPYWKDSLAKCVANLRSN